jgi:hypothetical protein
MQYKNYFWHQTFVYSLKTTLRKQTTKEVLIIQGDTYKMLSFEAFCDSLIREQDKLLHLGLITLQVHLTNP